MFKVLLMCTSAPLFDINYVVVNLIIKNISHKLKFKVNKNLLKEMDFFVYQHNDCQLFHLSWEISPMADIDLALVIC